MTKSLITLIGAIVSIAIVALAVVFGVLPLLGQSFTALGDTAQAGTTNQAYEKQISDLQKQKARKDEIDASVSDLRAEIAAVPDLDQAFDVISGSAQNAGVVITSITRGDLAAYVARTAPIEAGPAAAAAAKKAPSAPQPTPQPTSASDPVGAANSTAAQANSSAAQTSQAAGAGSSAAPTPVAAARQQIPIAVVANASDMTAVQAFLDGLRGSGRLLGVDKVDVTGSDGSFVVNLDVLAFVRPDAAAPTAGASR